MSGQDSANSFLQIQDSLTYSAPSSILNSAVTFASFKPIYAGSYGPNSSIEFRIRSETEFVDLSRSYFRYTLAEVNNGGAVAAAGTALSSIGASAVWSAVTDVVSGLSCPTLKSYNVLNGVKLSIDTQERKAITTIAEAYGNGSPTVGAAGTFFPAKSYCMPVVTSLASSNKQIPLAALTGGWNINLTTAAANIVFTNINPSNSYQVSGLEMVMCMVQPDQSDISELKAGLARGGTLKIPLQLNKNIQNSLVAASTQSIRVPCGYLSSLNAITTVVRQGAVVGKGTNTAGLDSFTTSTNTMQQYYVSINSQRYPRNRAILVNNDPENLYQMLAGFNTRLSSLSPFSTTNAFTHYSFESSGGAFAAGIPCSDSYLNLETDWSTTPTAGDYADVFLEYSAILVIDETIVNLLIDV